MLKYSLLTFLAIIMAYYVANDVTTTTKDLTIGSLLEIVIILIVCYTLYNVCSVVLPFLFRLEWARGILNVIYLLTPEPKIKVPAKPPILENVRYVHISTNKRFDQAKRILNEHLFFEEVEEDLYQTFDIYLKTICFLANYNGNYIGAILCKINYTFEGDEMIKSGYIATLAIRPRYRRQGVAKGLITRALRAFKEQNCVKATLKCDFENIAGQMLYFSMGFKMVKKPHPQIHYFEIEL